MSFDTDEEDRALEVFTTLGESVTYRPLVGDDLSTVAIIDKDVEVFDSQDAGVAETRIEVGILRSVVADPKRGDIVIAEDSTQYTVQDHLPGMSDKIEIVVSAK